MKQPILGQWIYAPALPPHAVPVFRRNFHAQQGARATLTITALGIYEAFINGHRVSSDVFAPGWTSYQHRLQVQTYDITPYLKSENTLTVRVAEGWFCPAFGFLGIPSYKETPMCLKCDIAVQENGKVHRISSDAQFEWTLSRFVSAELYNGEVIDMNREEDNWQPVCCHDLTDSMLIPQEGEPVREQEYLKPVDCFRAPDGEWIVDFGQNLTGYVCFSVQANGGEQVLIRHGEILTQDRKLYTENLRAAKAELRVTLKKGPNHLDSHLSFYGFRYIAISGWPGDKPDPDCFTAAVVHSDMRRTGSFACGVQDVNQLYHNILWGQKSNYLDVPTDCPQRDERLGWTGDAQVFIRAGAYNYDVKKFFTKWLRDVAADQSPTGGVPHTVPDSARNTPEEDREYSSAWADAACICPWQLYETYGDSALLSEHFPMMQKWVDHIRMQGTQEAVWDTGFHFGDWLGLDAQEGSYTGATWQPLIAQAMFANSTHLLIQAGHVLGKDVSAYEALYPRIVEAFRARYIQNGALTCATQTAHVLALHFNLCAPDDRPKLTDALVQLIHEQDDHLTTGFVGTPYLLHVLSDNGHAALAYKLLLNRTFPSWLFSVRMGATTMWEHWDGLKEDGSMWSADMNSFNHYAYGAVGDWLFGVCAGIRPAAPGYEKVLLQPLPDVRMGYVKAHYDTPYGRVESAWQHLGSSVRYTFRVPRNGMATAILQGKTIPLSEGETIITL